MFEPNTFWEKRAALTEALLLEMYKKLAPADRQAVGQDVALWNHHVERIKNDHALETVGLSTLAPEMVATSKFIERHLRLNLGRTYFNVFANSPLAKHNDAAVEVELLDGAIASSTFHLKFRDWVDSLPSIDQVISRDLESGFYSDRTITGHPPVPVLVLRVGEELLVITHYSQLDTRTLSLPHVPADMDLPRRWRSELFVYRGNVDRVEFLTQLGIVLSKHMESGKRQMQVDKSDLTGDSFDLVYEAGRGIIMVVAAPETNDAQPTADVEAVDEVAAESDSIEDEYATSEVISDSAEVSSEDAQAARE